LPQCFGFGVLRIEIAHTKKLKGNARLLYACVKATKYDVEILMHDQMKALEMVARHLGMLNDKATVKGDAQDPIHILVQAVQGSVLRPNHGRSITSEIANDDSKN
jgi:phage terminase small subunit